MFNLLIWGGACLFIYRVAQTGNRSGYIWGLGTFLIMLVLGLLMRNSLYGSFIVPVIAVAVMFGGMFLANILQGGHRDFRETKEKVAAPAESKVS